MAWKSVEAVRQSADPGFKKVALIPRTRWKRFFRYASACLVLGVVLASLTGVGCARKPSKNSSKIVTLTPSATEIVAALGAADRLVGVDDFSAYPEEVKRLPKVGGFLKPNFERIVMLGPDLVVADDIHTDTASALRDAGIDVVLAPMHSIPHLRAAFTTIGARIDRADAARAAIAELDRVLDEARGRRRGKGLRVLIVIDHEVGGLGGMVAAANGSWLDELVAITGAQNVLAGAAARYPRISAEEILRAKPDVILDVTYTADAAQTPALWRDLAGVPAVDRGKVHLLKDPFLMGPSPRVAEAIAAVEAALAR
jgi:iron complex transport system substrate-binding protein